MMKIAVCGVWHVHTDEYTKKAMELAEVIGVWDEDANRRKEFCERNNLPAFSSLEELLASDADGVIVCTATNRHIDVMPKIANAGKHIFTEKVLALTEEDCKTIEDAVQKNGVRFVISLIQKYKPGPLTVKQVVESGELGKINYLRFRNCHSGSSVGWLPKHFYNAEECGGGAMIDLGAHGMYLTDWICGVPETSRSVFTTACTNEKTNAMNTDHVEDNAVTVMEYSDGCIAINETGFVSGYCPMTLEVSGENGYVIFRNDLVEKCTTATEGKVVAVPQCEELPAPIVQFVTNNILDGCGMKEAKALTHLMVEAYR